VTRVCSIFSQILQLISLSESKIFKGQCKFDRVILVTYGAVTTR
jgi:hypothetical protein